MADKVTDQEAEEDSMNEKVMIFITRYTINTRQKMENHMPRGKETDQRPQRVR